MSTSFVGFFVSTFKFVSTLFYNMKKERINFRLHPYEKYALNFLSLLNDNNISTTIRNWIKKEFLLHYNEIHQILRVRREYKKELESLSEVKNYYEKT